MSYVKCIVQSQLREGNLDAATLLGVQLPEGLGQTEVRSSVRFQIDLTRLMHDFDRVAGVRGHCYDRT